MYVDSLSGDHEDIMRDVWEHYLSKDPSWDMVTHLYIKFLEGIIPATPLHLGPLLADTNDVGIRQLIKMNRLGFITVDSQPGLCEDFVNPMNGKSGKERQRQYISGFILGDLYENFVEKMEKNEDIGFIAVDSDGKYIKRHLPEWVPDADSIPVTVSKFDKDREWTNESWVRVENFDYFPEKDGYGPFYLSDFPDFEELHQWIAENTFYITLFAREFCQPNVMNDSIMNALI